MPKAPPIEDFVVSCRVPKEKLGPVVAALQREGVEDIHFNLQTTIPAFAKNAKPEVSSADFILAWIENHPTFRAIELVNAFDADGRGRTAAYPAIATLVEKGVLKKLGPGNYARADVKPLAPPKQKKEAKAKEHKTFDKSGTEVILAYAKRNHGRFNVPKILDLFESQGRARNSVYGSIDKLLNLKLCKRIGDNGSGQYVLLSKPQPKKPIETKEAPKPNGAAVEPAPEQNEVTHG